MGRKLGGPNPVEVALESNEGLAADVHKDEGLAKLTRGSGQNRTPTYS